MNRTTNQPREIFKNTAALALSRSIDGASSLFLSFFVARRLGAAGLGIYSAAIVFYGLISLAAEMGSTNFLVREISKDRSRTGPYLIHLGTITLAVSCLVMAAASVIVPHLGYSTELSICVYVVICATVPGTWRTIQEAVFVAHQRVEFITYSTLCAAAVSLSTSLLLLHEGYGIVSLVVAFAAVQYVVALCYFLFINRYISRLQCQFSLSFAITLLKEIRVFAGSSVLAGLFARPEVVILSFFRNEAEIGFYSAALRLVSVWSVIPQTYMTNVYPVLSHFAHVADRCRFQLILDKSIKYLLAISLPLTAGTYVAANQIINVLYGPEFGASVPSLRIMTWCIPLTFVSSVLWRLLAARGDQHLVLRAQIVTTITRLAGGYVLIASFASVGAAIGSTLSLLAHNLLLEFYVQRNGTRMRMFQLNWRLFVCAFIMGGGTAVFANRLQLWIAIPLAAGLYGAAAVLLRVLSYDDLALFRQAIHVPGRGAWLRERVGSTQQNVSAT